MTFYRSIFDPLYFIVPIFAGQSIFFHKKYRSFLHFSLILNTEGENFLTQLWHLWYISRLLQIKGQSYRNGAKRKGRPYFMAFLALQLTRTRSSSWHWALHLYCSPHICHSDLDCIIVSKKDFKTIYLLRAGIFDCMTSLVANGCLLDNQK